MARIYTVLVILFAISNTVIAGDQDVFQVETEGGYRTASGEPVALAKTVALFNARIKAVEISGRYLSRKSLIKVYERKRDEIYSLTANKIQTEILEENWETVGTTRIYRIRIRAKIQASDFVKAEMEDRKQEKEELEASYQEEMEQPVSEAIDPGRDIAKAYRLLREKKWRIAMIYLDHLEKKYPNWDSIYMAKAITHYLLNEPVFMKKALGDACRLGNDTACGDLQNIQKLHEHDFGISVVD